MNRIRPSKLRLEASTHCQLRCPSCPTTTGAINPVVGNGFLRFSDFERLVVDNPGVTDIELSNYGEILLNPELVAILKLAHARGIALRADNGVNLNHAKPELLEALVKYGVRSMTCSIDGATNASYVQYRVRGNLDRVLDNIRTINRFKAQYGSEYPQLAWQFVAFGHNEHEIDAARALAAELNMTFYVKLTWDESQSPLRDKAAVRAATGAASRDEFKQAHGLDYMQFICHQLWDRPQVNWDGKMLGCCRNFWGDFGPENAFRDGLANAVNSERMRYARRMLLGGAPARDDIPCTTCNIYLGMQKTGTWLQRPPAEKGPRWFVARVTTRLAALRTAILRRVAV